jgi:hypothetical protein
MGECAGRCQANAVVINQCCWYCLETDSELLPLELRPCLRRIASKSVPVPLAAAILCQLCMGHSRRAGHPLLDSLGVLHMSDMTFLACHF